MSYIPKYVQKRMIPKDAIKKVGDHMTLTIINVITPLSASIAPTGQILDYLQVKVQGDQLTKEQLAAVEFETNGQKFTMGKFADAGIIAVGQTVTFHFKSSKTDALKSGDMAHVEILVPEVNVNINIEQAVA